MPRRTDLAPPPGALVSVLRHRVAFYETDGMRIVHHANYVRYLELARVVWMDEHHRPYREYMAEDLHFATTRVEIDYLRAARFDDVLEIATWLEHLGGASLRMAYRITRDGELVGTATTEHAMVDGEGHPRRIPRAQRAALREALSAPSAT